MEANLVEIMSSIQGEGLFVGRRQVFLRFSGCNLSCAYCDTPTSFSGVRECRVERTPGTRDFMYMANPLTPEAVAEVLDFYNLANHHSLSFTGGEPLLQADFLRELLPLLKGKGTLLFLETNGTLPDKLESVIDLFDIISMDIKLIGRTPWEVHAKFLQVASSKQVYVKVVILPETSDAEIVKAATLVRSVNRSIPLILQPVTPCGSVLSGPSPKRMIEVQDLAFTYLKDVRVIPQTHKIMGQL